MKFKVRLIFIIFFNKAQSHAETAADRHDLPGAGKYTHKLTNIFI